MCNLCRIHLGVVRIVAAWTICAAVFAASASAGPTVTSKTVEPAVIPGDGSSGAVVTVRTDLPASSVVNANGFLKGTANPFAVATQGIGSLNTSVTCPPQELPPFDDVAICRFCPPDPCSGCPALLRGIDLIIYPEVTVPGILTSLHTKLLNAGAAYLRGQLDVAAGFLRAFLNEIKAQGGRALTTQAATAITALTVRAAVVLEIPLERAIEKAP